MVMAYYEERIIMINKDGLLVTTAVVEGYPVQAYWV